MGAVLIGGRANGRGLKEWVGTLIGEAVEGAGLKGEGLNGWQAFVGRVIGGGASRGGGSHWWVVERAGLKRGSGGGA